PDKAFSQHPALIVGCDACASYPTYKSHLTVGRIRRLRRIRQEQQTQVQQPVIKLGNLIFARCITFNYSYTLLLLLFI
ncbi:hypothetical protein RF144_19260, partial [Escherichia coli]|nr:hypothetical protein [Escherichia coli]